MEFYTLGAYHSRFKRPLKFLLVEYFRLTLNPELKLDESKLKAIGMNECGVCIERSVMDLKI